jgi:hypothetical protein
MMSYKFIKLGLSDNDLEFLVETVSPEVSDKSRLKQVIQEDKDFRNAYLTDITIFRRLMDDDEALLRISPALFFEILLRKGATELGARAFTMETSGTMHIPVFDTPAVVELLADDNILLYLAHMLSTFTRVESYTFSVRIGPGIWQKIRFNDLDLPSLRQFAQVVAEEHRLGLYKRIADVCLFVLGIFPDYAEKNTRYPLSGKSRPHFPGHRRISPEQYEADGRRFYELAAEHPSASDLQLSEVFWTLHQNFQKARKPLNYIAEHYLRYRRSNIFG